MWSPEDVSDALLGTAFEQKVLPAGIGYTISVRRATRAGDFDGAAIEDVGVQGHRSYAMTRRDLTGNNGDLRAMCGRLLATQPLTGLELTLRETTVRAAAKGLDRLDVYVDGRPVGWHDLSNEREGDPERDLRAPPR